MRFLRALRPFHDILSICAEKVNSMPSEPATPTTGPLMAAKKVVDVIPDVIDLISPDESESSSEIERQLFCKRRKVFPAVSGNVRQCAISTP